MGTTKQEIMSHLDGMNKAGEELVKMLPRGGNCDSDVILAIDDLVSKLQGVIGYQFNLKRAKKLIEWSQLDEAERLKQWPLLFKTKVPPA